MWFFKKRIKPETTTVENSINIHEDHVGMRNLFPSIVSDAVFAEMDKAIEASEKNRSESGLGWDDIHVPELPEKDYSDAGLLLEECAKVLEEVLPRVNNFIIGLTPNNPFYCKEEDAYCYGFGNHLFIKLETKGQFVSNIWYDIQTHDMNELTTIRQAFLAIEALSSSVITDFWLQSDGYLADSSFLDAYFEQFQNSKDETSLPHESD